MAKCAKCSKVLNTKSPGIQCCKCNKWFHSVCVSITADQLTTLYQTEAADWKCRACAGTGAKKPKRLSYVLPDPDDEDNNSEVETATDLSAYPHLKKTLDQMLATVRKEVSSIISTELQKSLQYYSDKIDDFEKKTAEYDRKLKLAQNKYIELENKFKNMELKNEVLEQKYNSIQQDKMANEIEICGIEREEGENVEEIAKQICIELKQKTDDIIAVRRKDTSTKHTDKHRKRTPIIKVSLKVGSKEKWIKANKELKSQNTMPEGSLISNKNNYIREALSPTTAFLLYKTKTELKDTGLYKFVWCKDGNILVRKEEREKIFSVRIESDIKKLAAIYNKST